MKTLTTEELLAKIEDKNDQLRQFAKEAVEKDNLIKYLQSVDNRPCLEWKIVSVALIVYVIVREVMGWN